MKNTLLLNFLPFLIINFYLITNLSANNKIVAKIENEIITNFDIENKILITLLLNKEEINQKNINKIKKISLDSLVNNRLKKIEMSKYSITSDTKQINIYLNSILSNDVENFKKILNNNGLDFQLFYDEIDIQLKWQKFIYEIYSQKIKIDEKAILAELDEIKNKGSDLEEYNISEIEIALNNNEEDQNIIDNIKALINKQGFELVALKHSISPSATVKGNLGWISTDSLAKKIYNKLYNLKIGQVTFLRSQRNILFLKLNDKRVTNQKSLDLEILKKNLINRKKNELFTMYSRSHLLKLKNTSLIEYK